MATNPRIPDRFTPQKPGSEMQPKQPTSATPGVILAIIVALLLLGAILYFMPRAPKPSGGGPAAASVPPQPVPGELQISHSTMTTDPTGNSVNLDAEISNTGQHQVNGIQAEISFTTTSGQIVKRTAKVMTLMRSKQGNLDAGRTEDLTVKPIQPGEMRAVRMTIEPVPAQWDHRMPGIRFITVTAQ